MTPAERRQTTRYLIDMDAVIVTPTASIPVHIVDIGAGGIRITSPEPIFPDTDVGLSLATDEEFILSGTILWSVEMTGTDGTLTYDVGIEAEAFILKDQVAISIVEKEPLVLELLSRTRRSS